MFDPISLFIQLIVGVVLSVASTLLKQAFAKPTPEQQRRTGTRGSAQIGGKVPQYFLVGTVGEAGKLEYRNTWGNSGEVPNAYLTEVYSFGDLPISGLTGLYVNGTRVTLASSGAVEQGFPVPEYSGHLWWKFFDGRQSVADSYLVGKFGGDAERPWLSDMIGVGVPYLVATSLWSETLWTGFPAFLGEFEGIALYDPRQDTTAGGSGSHRWGQPETYAPSDNNMVIIYNIERGIYFDGAHVWGGKKTAADLPYEAWAAAMDACDEAVELEAGGTEKRFRAGRRIDLNERPADIERELLIGCNGRISHTSDGKVYPLVGVPSDADGAFSDADVLATEPLGSIPFPDLDGIINGATATYREPAQAWEDKETAPYLRSDLEEEDDGRQQIEGLDLGTTFSGTQAQRIIKAVIEEGRRFRTHVVALPPEFAQFRPLQVLAWTSDRFDYAAKLFLITSRSITPWGQVVLGLQEVDPADHDWVPSTDERPLTFAPIVTNRPPPQEVSGFFVEPAIAMDSEGRPRRPAIDVFWSAASATVDVRAVRITVALPDGVDPDEPGTLVWDGEAPRPELGSARVVEAILPNEDYLVQIQYVPLSGRATIASAWLPVITPNVKLGAYDVVYGDLNLDEVSDQLRELHNWIGENFREVYDQLVAQAVAQGDQEAANSSQFSTMRRELALAAGEMQASFTETVNLAIVPVNGQLVAIGDALTELTAGDPGGTGTARWRMRVVSGDSGSATLGLETRFFTGDPNDFDPVGLYMTSGADGTRELMLDASRVVMGDISSGTSTNWLVYDDGIWRVADLLVGEASIQDLAVTRGKIAEAAIGSAEIEDGTIVTAKIGDAQITNAKLGTASVDTIKIAAGGVTTLYASTNPSPITIVSGFNQRAALSLNITEGAVLVQGFLSIGMSGSVGGQSVYALLRRNGVDVAAQYVAGVGGDHPVSLFYVDENPGGSVTYQLGVVAGTVATGGAGVYAGSALMAFNNKR